MRVSVRACAVSVHPPVVYPRKPVPRRYGPRKSHLYDQYSRLLADAPLVFLQHKHFTARNMQILRREIELAAPSLPPALTVMRTSVFGVALRDHAPDMAPQIANLVQGGLAVLALPSLNPPQLNAIIRAIDRVVPPKKVHQTEAKPTKEDSDWVPGRPVPRVRPVLTPELKVMGALFEGRVFSPAGVRDVTKLPPLDTLRAQIVGLLSTPAMQLAAVLSEASGGKLARALEGFKKGLEGQSS